MRNATKIGKDFEMGSLLTEAEVAERLRVSLACLRRWRLFLMALSIVLPNFLIRESSAANFILISAIFLAMKNKQNERGHYSGYSRFSCVSMEPLANPKDINAATNIVNHMNPEAAILTGIVSKGAIHLKTDKAIGSDISGCSVSELTVTPFGAGAVAAEWLEGSCQGGNLTMRRAAR